MDDSYEIFNSRDIYEFFQNSFQEEHECKHTNTYIDEAGLRVCPECGLEFEMIDFTNECNWYNQDRSRCSCRWYPKPKGSAKKVLEAHHVEIPRMIRDIIENKYQHICKVEGKLVYGKYHVSIITVLFVLYLSRDWGVSYLSLHSKEIQCHKTCFFHSIVKYMNAFPEARSYSITPEKLLLWMMKLAGVDQSHYQPIIKLCRLLENSLKRACPQSVAGAVIYLYLCLNPDYMNQLGLTRKSFAQKVQLSAPNVIKSTREIARNSFEKHVLKEK